MAKVTVDSDDLETLLYATAAIKDVENALKARGKDGFLARVIGRYTEAHERVARAWRDATRKVDRPELKIFLDPTQEQIRTLQLLFVRVGDGSTRSVVEIADPRRYRDLLSYGLIEFGVEQRRYVWLGSDGQITASPNEAQVIRLTQRGSDALADASA